MEHSDSESNPNPNPNPYVNSCHMYYMNLITKLKIRFAEEKGYMQSQIVYLEKEIDNIESKLDSSRKKVEDLIKNNEKLKADNEIDKFLYNSRNSAIQKLLESANKEINEYQKKLKHTKRTYDNAETDTDETDTDTEYIDNKRYKNINDFD